MQGDFPAWLRYQLKRREWTQADFARRLGTSTGTVSRWATGERVPDPESAHRIADVLGVDRDVVLALTGHREPEQPLKPDDPILEVIALVKRVHWNPERLDAIRTDLERWIRFDKMARDGNA